MTKNPGQAAQGRRGLTMKVFVNFFPVLYENIKSFIIENFHYKNSHKPARNSQKLIVC